MCFCCTEMCLYKIHPGADDLECHHLAHSGQPGNQAQPAQFQERCCLVNLVFFYGSVTSLVDEGKAVVLSVCTSVKLLTPLLTAFSWVGQVQCSLGKKSAWVSKPRE